MEVAGMEKFMHVWREQGKGASVGNMGNVIMIKHDLGFHEKRRTMTSLSLSLCSP